jgi:hypothetical protein
MAARRESIVYIETDIPPQMTCADYKRARAGGRRRTLRAFLRRRAPRSR